MSDTWSSTPPTGPGWWWCALVEGGPPQPVRVFLSNFGFTFNAEWPRHFIGRDVLWGPKIEDPQPPPVPGGER